MSNQNKVLLIAAALVAFVIGAAINSARVSTVNKVDTLLNAQLLTSENNIETVSQHLAKYTLINFWASWCSPCRREMPLFQAVYERQKEQGFQIIGIAIDNPDKAEPLLDSMSISYPILYAAQTGMTLMELSGNEVGAMPYSILVDQNGNVIDQKLGEIHEPQLLAWSKGLPYEVKQ